MKRNRRVWLAGVMWVAALTSSSAAELSVEGVLRKYVAALGGEAAVRKPTSRALSGEMTIEALGVKAPIQVRAKAPDKYHSVIQLEETSRSLEGFDGKISWKDDPFSGKGPKNEQETQTDMRHRQFHRAVELGKIYAKLELDGESDVRGKKAVVLKGQSKEGAVDRMHFDAATGDLLREEVNQLSPGSREFGVVIEYGDYRAVDGVRYAHESRIMIPQLPSPIVVKLTKVSHGEEYPDSLFVMPQP